MLIAAVQKYRNQKQYSARVASFLAHMNNDGEDLKQTISLETATRVVLKLERVRA